MPWIPTEMPDHSPVLLHALSEDGSAYWLAGDAQQPCLYRSDDLDDTTRIRCFETPVRTILPLEEGILVIGDGWALLSDSNTLQRFSLHLPMLPEYASRNETGMCVQNSVGSWQISLSPPAPPRPTTDCRAHE